MEIMENSVKEIIPIKVKDLVSFFLFVSLFFKCFSPTQSPLFINKGILAI